MADLVADQIIDSLDVQFGRQSFLDAGGVPTAVAAIRTFKQAHGIA